MEYISGRIRNRELGWLSFNERVLQEAEAPSVPLLDRLRFLGIFSNNMDEFFRVRVATVKRMINIGKHAKEYLNAKPKKLLHKIHRKVILQQDRFENVYNNLLKALEKENVCIINEKQLNKTQAAYVKDYFLNKVRPSLVPVMLYKSDDFPFLREKSIYLTIQFIRRNTALNSPYALIEVPSDSPRFVVLPKTGYKNYIILLDDVIRFCLHDIFSTFNYTGFEAYTIKITRDAELDIDNDVSKSILEKISKSVKERKTADPVRLIYDEKIREDLLNFIKNSLELSDTDNLISGGRYHNFKDFIQFPDTGNEKLRYKPISPIQHPLLYPYGSMFSSIKKKDILLHFPYHSFNHIIDLLREAAIDPNVTSIKMTIYRIAQGSKVMNALINAVKNGKSVTVVVELQARFDEENNIYWSNRLQEEGIKVIFGVPGLKVHCKLFIIARKEGDNNAHYASIGTGNYNEKTSTAYCDHCLLTANKHITGEVSKLFHFLENNYKMYNYKHLLVSPFSMRKKFVRLVNREIENAKKRRKTYIILKLNSLVDDDMIEKLYEASNAGVKIKLIIRGICSLIPGVAGMSENIQVISIIDRYLEHSRIFIFCNNGQEDVFISSADWMTRNFDHRIEVACPVYNKQLRKELKALVDMQLRDNVKARWIEGTGNNQYKPSRAVNKVRAQLDFYSYLRKKTK